MANVSLCFGPNPCVKPFIFACKSTSASSDTGSGSGSGSNSSNTNFYKLLSLSSNKVGTPEIKRAYRTLALKYHPDVSYDQDTTKMFILLQTAYKTLVDPVSREEYACALGRGELGYVCVGRMSSDGVGECRRWEGQIDELKKRSSFRSENKEGSWGNRVSFGPLEHHETSHIVIEETNILLYIINIRTLRHLRPTDVVIELRITQWFMLRKVPGPITAEMRAWKRVMLRSKRILFSQKWFDGLRPVWSLMDSSSKLTWPISQSFTWSFVTN